ncbi:endonuclease/exonuclease/phosphatase family protein [Nesterenkonia rhizosphaerae]|uniref:Endonuclease/exonuclease/phosphatase family protein n=1 Tax=Nesterenkonia rhizosphaerae TaxID=1348272 RepID=A0ABP9FVZ6_9MICC
MRGGSAVLLALGLMVTTAAGAQSSQPDDEIAASANSSAVTPIAGSQRYYPAPGQPFQLSSPADPSTSTLTKAEGDLRVATLHAELTGDGSSERPIQQLIASLSGGQHAQARAIAQTAQINDPDVLVLTGVTYDDDGQIPELLRTQYLASGQRGESAIDYPYVYAAPTNSGLESGADLDGDGTIGGAGDAIGYGEFAGQHSTVVFSKHPILTDQVRTFQNFLWRDLPENSLPESRFSDLEQSIIRLYQSSLWDIPVQVDEDRAPVHIIGSAIPLPEDPTGIDLVRADDQRRVLAEYAAGNAWYLTDDDGAHGGLPAGHPFVVAGQHSAPQPLAAESEDLDILLENAALQDPRPRAVTEQPLTGRSGTPWHTDHTATRAVPGERDVRASYVLPSAALGVSQSGVFWPAEGEYGYEVVDPQSRFGLQNRLVWVDLQDLG